MKKLFTIILALFTIGSAVAQETDINKVYQSAVENYEAKDYKKSANEFSKLIELAKGIENLSDYVLFQGLTIFSGNI